MKTKIELITPAWAIEKLENHNPRNRNMSEKTAQSYATDMRNGRWVLNHQGLAFDTNGDLLDGQHRLWAVVLADKPVEMMVSYDVPVMENKNGVELSAMDTIDRGRPRNNGTQMQLCHGIKNGAKVAAACRNITILAAPNWGQGRLSTATCLLVYDIYGKDIEAVLGMLEDRAGLGQIVGPLAIYHHGEPEKTLQFCREYSTLENLSSPVRAFIKYREQNSIGRHANSEKTARILAQCIHAYHEGKTISRPQDNGIGRDFLIGMYPSLTKRIRDAVKPVLGGRVIKRPKPIAKA